MDNTTCQSCGWANAAEAPVCQRCGGALSAGEAEYYAPQPPGYAFAQPGAWTAPAHPGAVPAQRAGSRHVVIIVLAAIVIVAVLAVGFVIAIAVPSFVAARRAANEAYAIATLNMIAEAEGSYHGRHGAFGSLDELRADGLLDREVSDGAVLHGYRVGEVEVNKRAHTFEFNAEPTGDADGTRAFTITEDFFIRFAAGRDAPSGKTGAALEAESRAAGSAPKIDRRPAGTPSLVPPIAPAPGSRRSEALPPLPPSPKSQSPPPPAAEPAEPGRQKRKKVPGPYSEPPF